MCIRDRYKLCKKYNADIAVESICHFTDGKRPDFKGSTKDKLLNREEAICDFLYQKEISTSACGKLYSASILSGIRFKSGILYEDNLFLSDVFELSLIHIWGKGSVSGGVEPAPYHTISGRPVGRGLDPSAGLWQTAFVGHLRGVEDAAPYK